MSDVLGESRLAWPCLQISRHLLSENVQCMKCKDSLDKEKARLIYRFISHGWLYTIAEALVQPLLGKLILGLASRAVRKVSLHHLCIFTIS